MDMDLTSDDVLRNYQLYYPEDYVLSLIQLISTKSCDVVAREAAKRAIQDGRTSRGDLMIILRSMSVNDISYVGW